MTFRTYLIFMSLATILCWGAITVVLYAVDPFTSGISGMMLFYGSLFAALVGTLALVGIIIRKILFHEEPHFVQVAVAFRQSILFALFIIFLLVFAHAALLRWWLILFLVAFFTVIEYLLLSIWERHPHTSPSSE